MKSRHCIGFALAWFALQASYLALRYLAFGHEEMPLPYEDQYSSYRGLVVVHGLGGVTALVLGLLQLLPVRRFRHRWVGRVYLAGVLVAGTTGFPMAAWASGGWVARLSFFVLDVFWLVSAWQAWTAVRARRFALHRRWMVRNYALTYGAVILRLLLNALTTAGLAFDTVYPVVAWAGWVSCWLVAEVYLRSVSAKSSPL